jgi:hypothetical protein
MVRVNPKPNPNPDKRTWTPLGFAEAVRAAKDAARCREIMAATAAHQAPSE